MRKPSPALLVALLALFVALGGVGVAATGGTFILGQPNSADKTTALSSGVTTGPTLDLTNGGNRPAARFNTAGGVQPFIVTSQTKVANLNVEKLDGLSSESFTQGGGRLYSGHREGVSPGFEGTLLEVPGALTVKYRCVQAATRPFLDFYPDDLSGVFARDAGASLVEFFGPGTISFTGYGRNEGIWVHVLASRPFNRMTFRPAVLVDMFASAGWDADIGKCVFQGVAEVFG
jgi:hypothetical protein